MPSFDNKKQLRFVITIADGKVLTLEGFRAVVDIDKAGGMQMGTLRARVYGVSQSDMNAVTTLQWRPDFVTPNRVEVFAIDGAAETLVFAGNIVNAWGDYRGMPDVFLHLQAQAAYHPQIQATRPFSVKGSIDVATIMEQIAKDMGLAFENNNVHVMLTDVYLDMSLTERARELQAAANFDLYMDDKVLAITNRNEPRVGAVPLISAESGLIGYPTFDSLGVYLNVMFNPTITFGGKIKLDTDIIRAAGEWVVVSIAHRLESEKPGGAWFSVLRGSPHGFAIVK